MTRQRRPAGTFRTATPELKLKVIARMQELGVTRADLARAANVTTAAITLFLGKEGTKPKKSSTKLLPAIYKALKWPPPEDANPDEIVDELHDELTRVWPELDDTERAVLAMIVAKRTKRP